VQERRIAGAIGFPLDDAWIHLQFARNLAEGTGFSFNPGVPVSGSTAPLWTLLLAAGALLGGASVVMAKIVGTAITAGAVLATYRAALAWGAAPVMAVGAGVGLGWTGPIAWGALSGMEVPLAELLIAVALLALARGCDSLTALCSALAVLVRPEALLLVPLLLLARPLTLRRAALFAGIVVLVLAPAVAFSMVTVGAPVPATAAAKVEGGLLGRLRGIHEPASTLWLARPGSFAWEWVVWLARTNWLLPLSLVPALALVLAWRRPGRALAMVGLVLLAHPLGMAVLAPYRGPSF
jgi:hypothetical protein